MHKRLRQGIVLWLAVISAVPLVLTDPARPTGCRRYSTMQAVAEAAHRIQRPSDEVRDGENTCRLFRLRRYRRAARIEEVVQMVCDLMVCQIVAVDFELTEVAQDPIGRCDGSSVWLAPQRVPLRC